MEIRNLQALVGIAEYGSFSAAADALGTVQSNVSAHVARLERELGAPVVDRSTGRLTEEGEIVVARARRMLVEMDALVADVSAMRQEVVGTVRAGMIGTTGRWLVPRLYAMLRERHPGVQMTVSDGTSASLEPRLLSGQLDLAVVSLPVVGDELIATPLFEEDLMLVVPKDHPLASVPRPLPLAELVQLDLVLPLPNTALRDEIDGALARAGVTLHPAMELDGIRMIASLTFDGYGPAILPATAVPRHMRERFELVPLAGLPRRRVGVAQRRRGLPSAPTRAVIELLNLVANDPDERPAGLHPATVISG
ncbi:MAG TPA: LysR family transcriptional regulator [Acidimicrobiales bacterium]|nr:LysR family transcriptional regulator [Acidimicrobiales bacterium]